jgi:hypothetical protein
VTVVENGKRERLVACTSMDSDGDARHRAVTKNGVEAWSDPVSVLVH